MPVIINNSTGLAEELPQQEAEQLLSSGSHSVPLVNPQGETVHIPYNRFNDAMTQGFRQLDPIEMQKLQDYAKYSSPEEQLKTFAEGAGEAATFGLSAGLEKAAGIDPEAIKARKDINPGVYSAGQVSGLVGSSFLAPEISAGKALTAAGEVAAKAAGLGEATFLSRVASTGVKQMAEMALFQTGDEVAKAIVGDPDQSVSSAISDIALSSILGGAVGAGLHFGVGGLWNVTVGPKLEKVLNAVKSASENGTPLTAAAEKAAKAGIELDPTMAGAMTDAGKQAYQELRESAATKAGQEVKSSFENLQENINKATLENLGKTVEDIGEKTSNYEHGNRIRESIKDTLLPLAEDASKRYEEIGQYTKNAPMPYEVKRNLQDALSKTALENNFHVTEGSPEFAIMNRLDKSLDNVKTFPQFEKVVSDFKAEFRDKELNNLKRLINPLFDASKEDALRMTIKDQSPEIIERLANANRNYSELSNFLETTGDKIGLRRYTSPKDFIKKLTNELDLPAESLASRLGTKKDAALLEFLKERFPKTAELVKQYHIDNLPLKSTVSGDLNRNALFKAIDSLSPELKEFMFSPEQLEKFQNIREVIGTIPEKIGKSGSPEGIELNKKNLMSAIGALIGMSKGTPVLGALLGRTAQYLTKDAPDALKLSYLKMLSGKEAVSASGFNAMFKMAKAAYKAQSNIERGINNLFKPGAVAVESNLIPSSKQLGLLHASVQAAQQDPTKLENASGDLAHYMPDHAISATALAARATQYLSSIQPNTGKEGILDKPRQPSEAEKAKYNRALEIAEQPLMILKHIQDGTITPEDIKTFSTIYPSLQKDFSQKIVNKMIESESKKINIPFKTRLGLSLFLGQPLESSVKQQNIMANQALYIPPMPKGQAPRGRGTQFKASFSKLPNLDATPMQMRERTRGNK
mgnify:FL=1